LYRYSAVQLFTHRCNPQVRFNLARPFLLQSLHPASDMFFSQFIVKSFRPCMWLLHN
jgi:hypothetical protein